MPPIPKRSDQRIGHSHRAGGDTKQQVMVTTPKPTWPKADPDWCPMARRWYNSLRRSGQCEFYEPSDIAWAEFMAREMHVFLETDPERVTGRAEMMRALTTGMSLLLNTEADRRRAGVELVRKTAEETTVAETAVDKYKEMLNVTSIRPNTG